MRPATRNTIIGVSAAFVAIAGGLLYGVRQANVGEGGRRVSVEWEGPVPDDAMCIMTTGLASQDAGVALADGGVGHVNVLALFGLEHDGGPSEYVYCRMCGSPAQDGGADVPLPQGMEALAWGQTEEAYDGGPQLHCVLQGEPEWPCACALAEDGTCEWLLPAMPGSEERAWATAPVGLTLGEGQWRGDGGCYPKACVEISGVSSWPEACPL